MLHPPSVPLLNLPRARELLRAAGLDGAIATLPHNVYYASGYRGLLMDALHFDAAFIAVIPARDDQPTALVLPSMELRRLVTQGDTWLDETFIYSSPLDDDDESLLDGKPYGGWPVADNAALSSLERRWVAATNDTAGRVAGNARGALVRALDAAGLASGRLVADDARVGGWLDNAGLGADVACQPDFWRQVRLIKTEAEIALLRKAATINERAARTAATAFRDGGDWADIEHTFAIALADQRAKPSYIMCGAGGPRHGQIRAGEPMFIDALSTYAGYHGDFGRCVVVGEPSTLMRKRHAALRDGFAAAQPWLKPGTRFDTLADTVIAAVRQAGLPEFVYATPHSVGLEHTDDPRPVGGQQGMTPDTVLAPGMVINIDMPFTELGWGSVHIEDTLLITESGYESLTSHDLDIIQA